MSIAHWIQTIIEALVIAALIVGFIYEPILVKWEEKQKEKVIKAWKQRKKFRGENRNV